MAELIESSRNAFSGASSAGTEALARRIGVADAGAVAAAADVALPLLVDAVRRRLAEPDGGRQLAEIVGRTDPSGLADPAATFASGRYAPSGLRLVDHLLDDADARGRAAARVTDEAGLAPGTGAEVLTAAAWVVGAKLHDRAGSPVDGEALAAAVDGTVRRARPPVPTTALAPVVSEPEDAPLYRPVRPRPPNRAPSPSPSPLGAEAPDRRPVSPPASGFGGSRRPLPPGSDPGGSTVDGSPRPSLPPVPAAAAPVTPRPPVIPRHGGDVSVGSSRLVTGVAALLGLLVIGGALWWWFDRRDDETATAADVADDAATDGSAGAEEAAAAADAAGEQDGAAGYDQEAGTDAESNPTGTETEIPSSIDVAMIDPVGRSTATGSAGLRFDVEAGEVCYDIELDGVSTPADGHIHLGPAGVKGGIIIDFGPMENGATGCHPVPDNEMDAILADLDGHYVELHDPIEDFTIRAQLSEGIGPDGQPVGPTGDDGSDPAEPVLFDPDGGGATAIVEPGRIVLRGEVADREVAERVLVDFAGLSDVVVVDELMVVDDSPLPSGRVIIDSPESGLFATDSDQLDPAVGPLVDQLVALMDARPDWRITVVGHTDSTGDDVANLELSFRRAEAVRREMIDGGIVSDRIRVRGAGSTDPIADNTTLDGRAKNRRIEFEIER